MCSYTDISSDRVLQHLHWKEVKFNLMKIKAAEASLMFLIFTGKNIYLFQEIL